MEESEKQMTEVDDHEEGEITDDEEPVAEPLPLEANDPAIATENAHDEGNRDEDDEAAEAAAAAEARRSRRERKKVKKEKERRRHRDRELDSDEEKKRRLKKKLAALEMQMQEEDEDEDDEAMGVYANGGSPTQFRRQQRSRARIMEGSGGGESSSDGGGGVGIGSEDRERSPERKRKKSRERRRERRADKRRRPDKSSELCQLFMMGKCPKSPERCIFSHDAQPPQIFELCKFYLFDRCAKKEKCLYLHKGFPCKYFHTGHRCMDTAESCKFSHDPLNDDTRTILLKHLEAAPKEILGDFPRMSREQALNLVCKTECGLKGWTSHPLMENKQPPQSTPQQQPPLDGFEVQHNSFSAAVTGPQVGFNSQPRLSGFDQGLQPGAGGFPPQPRGPTPFRARAPGPDGFTPSGGGFPTRGGGVDYGPPLTPGLMGAAPSPQEGFGPHNNTASIQERLVQLSGGGGGGVMAATAAQSTPNANGLAPQPLMGALLHPNDAAPVAVAAAGGGERRRKSRWENQEQLPLPPPPLLQHPGATFRPPLMMNQPLNPHQQQHLQHPRHPPQVSHDASPPLAHGQALGRVRSPDQGFRNRQSGFGQGEPRNERNPTGRRISNGEEEEEEEDGQRTPPNTEAAFVDELDPFNPASEDVDPAPAGSPTLAPSGMPKAQQRLYERIQEKQMRERSGSPSPSRGDGAKETAKESARMLNEGGGGGWYSSDEDCGDGGKMEEQSTASASVPLPKELTDVLSSLRKSPGASELGRRPEGRGSRDPRKRDPRRDPRRNSSSAKHSELADSREAERDKRILEMDLGSVFGDLDLPTFREGSSSTVAATAEDDPAENDMGLPFKPHVVASVAKEIDASIYSHSPLLYSLRAIVVPKPDYSDLVTKQRLTVAQSQDPRLRRYGRPIDGGDGGETRQATPYNPGQDLLGSKTKRRDPRRRD